MTPGDEFEKEASRAPPRRTSGVGGERENDGRAGDRGGTVDPERSGEGSHCDSELWGR